VAIYPGSASCAGAQFPAECNTADVMAAPFAASLVKYKINSKAAQAAALSLALFESVGFQYNIRHSPVTPGVGTSNMQSAQFNREYATSLFGADKVTGLSDDDMLKLLDSDVNSFAGSAAWFMATQCPTVLAAFATDPNQAWIDYHGSGCISTTLTADRTAIFTAAKKVLGA